MESHFLRSDSLQALGSQIQQPQYYRLTVPLSDTYIAINNNVAGFVPLHVKIFNSATFPIVFSTNNGQGMPYIIQPNQLKSLNITGFENDTYIIQSSYTMLGANALIEFYSFKDNPYVEPTEAYISANQPLLVDVENTVSTSVVNVVNTQILSSTTLPVEIINTSPVSVSIANTSLSVDTSQTLPVLISNTSPVSVSIANTSLTVDTSQTLPVLITNEGVNLNTSQTLPVNVINYPANFNVISLTSNASYTNTYSYTASKSFEFYQTASVSGFSTYLIANSHTANITAMPSLTLTGANIYSLEIVSTSQSTPTNYQAIINIV